LTDEAADKGNADNGKDNEVFFTKDGPSGIVVQFSGIQRE
jgi:hypothetical protein